MAPPIKPLVLQKGSRLTVLSTRTGHQGKYAKIFVTARCECGTIKEYTKNNITTGTTLACGCVKALETTQNGASAHPLYLRWIKVLKRCYDPTDRNYHNYGGRGITVCEEWRNSASAFIKWAEENGYEENLQLDRRENEGNYEPGNCRFVTPVINANNTRANRYITYKDKKQSVADWARELKVNPRLIYKRLNQGWTGEEALTLPMPKL